MKRILDKPYEAGTCPCCGSKIEYGQINHMDNGGTINWEYQTSGNTFKSWNAVRYISLGPAIQGTGRLYLAALLQK